MEALRLRPGRLESRRLEMKGRVDMSDYVDLAVVISGKSLDTAMPCRKCVATF